MREATQEVEVALNSGADLKEWTIQEISRLKHQVDYLENKRKENICDTPMSVRSVGLNLRRMFPWPNTKIRKTASAEELGKGS